jgi:hypothetical protein
VLVSINNYIDLITSQHKTKPKFIAWLSSALGIINDDVTAAIGMPSSFDIDSAVGLQLDALGEIVGRERSLNFQPASGSSPVLDDPNYRIALKAKIAQNHWDGTIPAIYDIWYSLFSDVSLVVVDNQNMTMSALVEGQLDPVATDMVASGRIIPKPAGVGLTIIEVTNVARPAYVGILVSGNESITVSTIVP